MVQIAKMRATSFLALDLELETLIILALGGLLLYTI